MLPGVNRTRRTLADGRIAVHWYAWRGGPPILSVKAHPANLARAIRAAEAEAGRKYHDLLREREANPPAAGFVAAIISAYRESEEFAKLSERTQKDRRKCLMVLRDEFGDLPLKALDAVGMRSVILEWRKQYAKTPRTADHHLETFAALLKWARDAGKTKADPLANWPRLYFVDRSEVIWTPDEIEAVCKHANADLKRAILLAVYTGLRQGDLLTLTWASIQGGEIVRETRKRKRVVRIPITDTAQAVLDDCPKVATTVLTRSGKPWKVSTLEKLFSTARAAAKIEGKRWHDLRGSYATLLMSAGVENDNIDRIMGWAKGSADKVRARYVSSGAVASAVAERLKRHARKEGLK